MHDAGPLGGRDDFASLTRTLLEHSLVGIYVIQDGVFAWVNDRTAGIFGYTPAEMTAMRVESVLAPESVQTVLQNIAARISGEVNAIRYEISGVAKTGERRGIVVYGSRVMWGGRPAIGGMLLDVTERKSMEEKSRRQLAVLEQAQDVIFMTDLEGEITYVNPAFERLYGFSRAEALGKTPRILKSGHYETAFYTALWNQLLSGAGVRGEVVNRAKDGRFVTVESSATPIRDESGRIDGFICVQSDVTERKKLEEQVRQAQKMEAVGQLAGGIAHDFNNVLTAIFGYSDLLLAKTPSGREELMEIRRAADRAATLTRQLLAFSRRQILLPKVFDLNGIVRDLSKMLQRLIGENIELVVAEKPGPAMVKADPGQIEQVLLNLVLNARDALERGGLVRVETSRLESVETPLRAWLGEREGPWIVLSVRDNGTGMDAATQARVFEPFFTTKERGKGTGLGLATVYGIVKQSGGAISVSSVPDQGTEFRVVLPEAREAATPSGVTAIVPSPGGKETVLLVEDDESVRVLARTVLASAGYRVVEARNGEEALSRFRGLPAVDVVLTDVVMPKMGGRELAAQLAAEGGRVRVLYMSGYADELVSGFGNAGGVRILKKPFLPSELLRMIRDVLDRKDS